MAAHAPYIMPDGRSLAHYLHQEREREQLRRRKADDRGKDLQFAQLLRQRGSASTELELAELRVMESAGVRRRRRWLNDKTLRDLAGPLSAGDMEAQFKPAPFGMPYTPSPLAQALAPANAALWENFRNIDPEKEARVLQKWAAHQRESAPLRQRPLSQAALALQRWAAVGKKARVALKRANASSVMQLEMQVLDFFEQSAPGEQLVLPLEDGFARLLVHGLAEFYGLLSVSRADAASGATSVAVYRRTKPLTGSPAGGGGGGGADITLPLGMRAPQRPGSAATGSGSAGPSPGPSPGRRAGGGSTGPSPARGALAGASPVRGGVSGGGGAGAQQAGAGSQGAGVASTSVSASTATPTGAGPASQSPAGPGPSPTPSPGRRVGGTGASGVGGISPPPGARQAGAGGGTAGRSTSTGADSGRRGGEESGGGVGGGVMAAAAAAQQPAAVFVEDHEITCTDILLAMEEVGPMGINEEGLRRYVATHIHGTLAADGRQPGQQQRRRPRQR